MAHTEIANVLRRRMENAGLRIRTLGPVPALPEGWTFTVPATDGLHHSCEQHRLVELPLVLICDVRIEEPPHEEVTPESFFWESPIRFSPYWLVGTRVIHDWVPYPPEPFRAVTPIEAACIFSQHPYLGSVKAHLDWPGWGHPSIQVYRCPKRCKAIISRFGLVSYNHHAAFCRYAISFDGAPVGLYKVEPPKPSPPPEAPKAEPAAETPPPPEQAASAPNTSEGPTPPKPRRRRRR